MNVVFANILNMSWRAGFVILTVLVIRLLLNRAPKLFSYLLWSAVLFRLICPFTFQTNISLMPDRTLSWNMEDNSSGSLSGPLEKLTEPSEKNPGYSPAQTDSDSLGLNSVSGMPESGGGILSALQFVWLTGMLLFAFYGLLSLARLKKRLKGATNIRDNIFCSEHILSPFVFGIIRPKIYLPAGLSEQESRYIILHEQTHIRRRDYLFRIAAFAALILHWFNPLVWLAFVLSDRDMEMACDESVLKRSGAGRRDYSFLLIKLCSKNTEILSPISFGNGDIRGRIKNILRFKKPPLWAAVLCTCVIFLLCMAFISDPRVRSSMNGWEQRMTVTLEGTDSSIQPAWYEGGFDFKYDRLLTLTTDVTQTELVFQSEDPTMETLLLGEDYYSNSRIYRETYEIEKSADGRFHFPVTKKINHSEETAYYFAKYGDGVFVFGLQLPAESAEP